MASRGVGRFIAAQIFAVCVGALPAFASSVVDRAEIRVAEQFADIEIKFLVPINIGAHAPAAHGELLQIEIELPGSIEANEAVRLGATEWMAGSQPSANTLYEYIRFDRRREPNRGRLVIRFFRDVDFTVYKSLDSRSVVISILKAKLPVNRPEKLPGQSTLLAETPRVVAEKSEQKAAANAVPSRKAEEMPVMTVLPPLATVSLPAPQQSSPAAAQEEKPNERIGTSATLPNVLPPPEPAPQTTAAPVEAAGKNTDAAPKKPAKNDGWRVYGDFSQFYNYSDIKIDRSGDARFSSSDTKTSQNNLRSYLNLNARYRDDDWDVRSRFGGGYRSDFLDHSHDTFTSRYAGDKFLLSDAYIDARSRRTDVSAKIGRQYGSAGGVFGRFDGAQIGVPVIGDWRANVVGGTPVDSIYEKSVDGTHRYFYGVNMDFAPKQKRWQTNVYALQETVDGIIDRRAVGNETRYYGEGRSLLTLLDYDLEFSELGRALMIANWSPFKRTALSATFDYGFSPLLSTRNALISQPDYNSIKELQRTYNNAEIRQLARDRTAKFHTMLLSVTQQLSELSQIYASIGEYYYGALPASGGVEAMPATGNEYDYSLQYIRTDLLQKNDTHSFGLRHYDGSFAQSDAAGIDARYAWGDSWRLSPRFWIERRNNLRDDSDEWVYRPSVRIEYGFKRRYHLEFEASRDIYKGEIPEVGTQDIVGNFLRLGYRIDID